MHQTVVTLSADIQPRSLDTLRKCIQQLKTAVEHQVVAPGADPYEVLGSSVPSLHFASIMVFEDAHYDPLLTVELNIDGDIGPFLPQLETSGLQDYLRTMVRCCKKPDGRAGMLYDNVTREGSKIPLAAFLETCLVKPAVFHQGNRGLDRRRIARESVLFNDVQVALDQPALYQAPDAVTLHRGLRASVIAHHPWIGEPETPRWTSAERAMDVLRLFGFVSVLLACLSIPGMVLSLMMPWWVAIGVCLIAAVLVAAAVPGLKALFVAPPTATPPVAVPGLPYVPPSTPERKLIIGVALLIGVALYLVGVGLVFTFLLAFLHLDDPSGLFRHSFLTASIGLLTVPLPLAIVFYWIRWLEQRDSTQENPHDDIEKLRAILASEDQIAQNHMGSLVLIKPGVLRAIVIRVGLWGLGLGLRALQTNGYLASMRTIHFAHWAILNNGGRLVFFSNFDASWESYLDDFIEKAHVGLTLAWTNGVGFAPTEFLINKGATSGRLFKAWARHSMAETLFWFSAYKDLSVNQIERQCRVASGLCRPSLSPEEAARWACDL